MISSFIVTSGLKIQKAKTDKRLQKNYVPKHKCRRRDDRGAATPLSWTEILFSRAIFLKEQ